MDASKLPKGQSAEVNSDGRPVNLPGVYVHTPTGKQFITSEGNEGVSQADSLMTPLWQGQWERVGDVPTRVEILAMNKKQLIKDSAAEALQKGKEDQELKDAIKAETEKLKSQAVKEPVTA